MGRFFGSLIAFLLGAFSTIARKADHDKASDRHGGLEPRGSDRHCLGDLKPERSLMR
jgi:hypothetical protein